jgi:hypothetical protein
MRQITYAGGSFITSDAVAQALLDYGAALANADRAATVHVPATGLPGDNVAVLVGPASQLLAQPYDGPDEEIDGTAFIHEVTDRTRQLERTFTVPGDYSAMDWDI